METQTKDTKMTYYKKVKSFADKQQVLLDEFLAEVVATGIMTKTKENTTANRNKVYWNFVERKFNSKTVNEFSDYIAKMEQKFQDTGKDLYKEMVLENQFNIRFWNIAKPLYQANRKLEQIKYFASK
jgi:hypothetical protein